MDVGKESFDPIEEERESEQEAMQGGPLIRSIPELVISMRIVEAEMWFQIKRLQEHVKARTEEEGLYFDDLELGYRTSARYIRRLRRYHEQRIARKAATGSTAPETSDHADAIVGGKATAYTGDEE